jgi:hypothetical protein
MQVNASCNTFWQQCRVVWYTDTKVWKESTASTVHICCEGDIFFGMRRRVVLRGDEDVSKESSVSVLRLYREVHNVLCNHKHL